MSKRTTKSFSALSLALALMLAGSSTARADDTDIYLNPSVASGAEPLVMLVLDYRPNLASTVCNGPECDDLVADGYLAGTPTTFFDLFRAVLKKVLDPLGGVKIGFMMNHDNSCVSSGPGVAGCSNGAYVLSGFEVMDKGTDDPTTYQATNEDPDKIALFSKLDAIPTPIGAQSHSFQGKEIYFELFRYLTGQDVYNGHLGYEDFGNTDSTTNLDVDFPAISWDTSVEGPSKKAYRTPLDATSECSNIFVINFLFQVSNQEDDSDVAIKKTKANGGMEGIRLVGPDNSFDTVIAYMNDADLADGTYGTAPNLDGKQNVVSYFIVDPTSINKTTTGYASAGGTGTPLPLSADPAELIATLESIFDSILSVSTTFVAPSVPVNVFNRSETANDVFFALFEADENGYPFWPGNLKKLRIEENLVSGDTELQDANGVQAIDIDGRIKRDALTLWTDSASLPPPVDDEVAGADGRSIMRGGAGQQLPGFVAGSPGQKNSDAGARQLFTDDPTDFVDGLMPLEATVAAATALWSDLTASYAPPVGATYATGSKSHQSDALNDLLYMRGLDAALAVRPWLMGDPLHSRPSPVNYGARGGGYDAVNPDIRILMGTNDGVLHMFRNTDPAGAEDGSEVWGYLPREVLGLTNRLRLELAGKPVHPASVDGSTAIYSVDNNFDGNLVAADGDKVYAYFGLRRGGKSIYALDISDPDAPKKLWQITKGAPGTDFAELAQTWSTPQIGKVQIGASVVPVLVFGGGYNGDDLGDNLGDLGKDAANRVGTPGADDDEGNAIFIVNALDGSLVWKAIKGASIGYSSATRAYTHPALDDSFGADVTAIDGDGDGLLDRIYAGDTGGVLWRFDLAGLFDHDSNGATPDIRVVYERSVWSGMKLLTVGRHAYPADATKDRRFHIRPDVAQSRDDLGPFDAVIIGTGDRENPLTTAVGNWFYMVKDRYITSGYPPTTTLTDVDLADLSSNCLQDASCAVAPDLANGWRITLAAPGEKNLASPVTVDGAVYFTTFEPSSAIGSACTLSEGLGRLYAVSLQNATALINFDTTNDTDGSGNPLTTYERSDKLGSGGIPVQVVPLSEGKLLVQGQEVGENILDTGAPTGFRTYWTELYM